MKGNCLWQQLYSLQGRVLARKLAGGDIEEIMSGARHESEQLGISLDYVLTELADVVRATVPKHEWRQYGDYVLTLDSFLMNYGGSREQPPEQWLQASKADTPSDPNFHQLAPVLGFGKDSPGFGKICPRDGKPDCSYVDGIRKCHGSDKATHFLSWAWSYNLSLPLNALQHWADKNPWERHHVNIWWCFFSNNQFRILQGGKAKSTKDLAIAFGQNVKEIGKAWMLMDRLQQSTYTSRIWCIFEVYVARKHDVPCNILIDPRLQLECDHSINSLQELDEACRVHAEHATASHEEDEKGIKQEILEQFGSFDEVNDVVEKQLRSVITEMRLRPGQKAAASSSDSSQDLPHLLSKFRYSMDQIQHGKDGYQFR